MLSPALGSMASLENACRHGGPSLSIHRPEMDHTLRQRAGAFVVDRLRYPPLVEVKK